MLTGSYMWCLFCLGMLNTSTGSLTVDISALESREGAVRAALYPSKSAFDNEEIDPSLGKVTTELSGTTCTLEWTGLPYGIYALAVFHDINDNGELDTNAFGIPTEPYAFSNNPDVKWRRPRFGEISFRVDATNTPLELKLSRWSER